MLSDDNIRYEKGGCGRLTTLRILGRLRVDTDSALPLFIPAQQTSGLPVSRILDPDESGWIINDLIYHEQVL